MVEIFEFIEGKDVSIIIINPEIEMIIYLRYLILPVIGVYRSHKYVFPLVVHKNNQRMGRKILKLIFRFSQICKKLTNAHVNCLKLVF